MNDKSNIYLILGSLVALAIVIGLGILLGSKQAPNPYTGTESVIESDFSIPAITEEDHIKGNKDADVILVEYSDTECPFCKEYHLTVTEVQNSYAPNEFAWVFRNYPLTQIHPRAVKEAQALECAADVGGEDAFWRYLDRIFEITPSNNQLDPKELPVIAQYIGIDVTAFNTCLDDNETRSLVNQQAQDAASSGGMGTPYNVFILKNALTDAQISSLKAMFVGSQPGLIRIADDRKHVALGGGLPAQYLRQIIDLFRGVSTSIDTSGTSTQATTTTQ